MHYSDSVFWLSLRKVVAFISDFYLFNTLGQWANTFCWWICAQVGECIQSSGIYRSSWALTFHWALSYLPFAQNLRDRLGFMDVLDSLLTFLEHVCRLPNHQWYVLALTGLPYQSSYPILLVKFLANIPIYCHSQHKLQPHLCVYHWDCYHF